MRFVLRSFLLFALLGLPLYAQTATDSLPGEIRLRTYVDSESVPLNGEVVYHVELTWPGELGAYKIAEIKEPVINNLTTRGSGSSNRVTAGENGTTLSVKEITFYFTPLEMGMAYIDGVTIAYEDVRSGSRESLISARVGVKITEALPEPGDNGRLGTLGTLLFLLAVIVLAIYFFIRYRQRRRLQREKDLQEVIESVEEKYLRMLKETVHLNSVNYRDSIGDLAHLLSGYFSERFRFHPSGMNENELKSALKETELSDDSMSKILHFYARVNLIRFAGESAGETDFHQLYDTVEHFLEKQKSSL